MLLARRRSGLWSIPAGEAEQQDGDSLVNTAVRETIEEFGCPDLVKNQTAPARANAPGGRMIPQMHWRLGVWEWTTLFIELPHRPERFPDRSSLDFTEFTEARWFALPSGTVDLPKPTELLPRLAVWKLRWHLRRRQRDTSID